jgi:hypothetical protein
MNLNVYRDLVAAIFGRKHECPFYKILMLGCLAWIRTMTKVIQSFFWKFNTVFHATPKSCISSWGGNLYLSFNRRVLHAKWAGAYHLTVTPILRSPPSAMGETGHAR